MGAGGWWAVLPINYDVLYEVHLFALLPELVAVLIALAWTGSYACRGFAVLLASTLLMRNEVVIALVVWTAAWIVYEVRARRQGTPTAPRKLLGAVGIPLLVIAAVMGGVAASSLRGDFVQRFNDHADLSICQAYAIGYQQRHEDFKGNPSPAVRC